MSKKITPPNSVIRSLVQGYQRFYDKHYKALNSFKPLVEQGQHPKTLVIACCDSRVDPAILTDCLPGELFVVRNVANLVPPYKSDALHHGTSAALEYGVLTLEVTDIIVLGHSLCGGIHSLMTQNESLKDSDFIHKWINIAQPAKEQVLLEHSNEPLTRQSAYCEKASLLNSLKNLNSFPWIRARIKQKKLSTHAWYFRLDTGTLECYASLAKQFVPFSL